MRHLKTFGLALALALVVTACGGSDSTDTTTEGTGSNSNTAAQGNSSNNSGDPELLTANFNLDDLPSDFDSQLVPPSWTAGQSTDILGPRVVNFETDMSFDEVMDHYEGVLGAATLTVGDPGEQLAQWTDGPVWILSVLDGDPVTVGFVSLEE